MKLTIEEQIINGVPISHYRIDDDQPRKLIIGCHGFMSHRYSTISDVSLQLARRGYHVVTLDAFMHGERGDSSFLEASNEEQGEKLFDIIFQTVKDIKMLIEHLKEIEIIDSTKIGITGISMGGMMSYLAAATIPKISVVAEMIGTPDYITFVNDILAEPEQIEMYQSKLEQIAPFNPIDRLVQQKPIPILMCHGRQDEVVPINSVNQSYKVLRRYYKEQDCQNHVKYLKYFCKHEVPSEMKRAVYDWFELHL
ncbi:MAG: alpha/beta hydrolase family protein [Turicibacter sp.]